MAIEFKTIANPCLIICGLLLGAMLIKVLIIRLFLYIMGNFLKFYGIGADLTYSSESSNCRLFNTGCRLFCVLQSDSELHPMTAAAFSNLCHFCVEDSAASSFGSPPLFIHIAYRNQPQPN
jgi:hypothetical protein